MQDATPHRQERSAQQAGRQGHADARPSSCRLRGPLPGQLCRRGCSSGCSCACSLRCISVCGRTNGHVKWPTERSGTAANAIMTAWQCGIESGPSSIVGVRGELRLRHVGLAHQLPPQRGSGPLVVVRAALGVPASTRPSSLSGDGHRLLVWDCLGRRRRATASVRMPRPGRRPRRPGTRLASGRRGNYAFRCPAWRRSTMSCCRARTIRIRWLTHADALIRHSSREMCRKTHCLSRSLCQT